MAAPRKYPTAGAASEAEGEGEAHDRDHIDDDVEVGPITGQGPTSPQNPQEIVEEDTRPTILKERDRMREILYNSDYKK